MTTNATPTEQEGMMSNDELRRLAGAATPDAWYAGTAGSCNVVSFGGDDITGVAIANNPANRDYIAAANPQVILALLDELDVLREVVRAADGVRDIGFGYGDEWALFDAARAKVKLT